jgi:cytochrome bd ubiquinol oxidase subunit I
MNVEILARCQFALTVAFHYIFPTMSIGLGLILVIIESIYLKTRNPEYLDMAKFWVRIFGLTFAVGVATGLVQIFEFGTNWATFSRYVGDVFGSALGAEGIFAFALESGFLAILLFGWDRVGPKTHFFATLMVFFGACFSAVWIIIANSWMQTPAGFTIVGEGLAARAEITSLYEMIFNPSTVDRLVHVLIGCFLTGAFLVLSVAAYYILKGRHLEFARVSIKISLIVATVMVIAQSISGDSTARGVAKNQPEKLAAAEGVFKTEPYTPMWIIGWVNQKEQKVSGINVPGLLSFLVYRNPKTPVIGLDTVPESDWPFSPAVFQTYHLMLMAYTAMLGLVILGWLFYNRMVSGRSRWLLWLMVISVVLPQIANQAGWFTAEMGRQPWVVYHLLRTSDALSQVVVAQQVLGSIIMFGLIYSLLFALFIYLLNRKIQHGPEMTVESPSLAYKKT